MLHQTPEVVPRRPRWGFEQRCGVLRHLLPSGGKPAILAIRASPPEDTPHHVLYEDAAVCNCIVVTPDSSMISRMRDSRCHAALVH